MICVTGASGTLGSEVIKQLEAARAPFRAAYFSKKAADAAHARGIDAVIIDYNDPETLRAAFGGCDKLFLLGPNLKNQTELELKRSGSGQGGWRATHREAVRDESCRRGVPLCEDSSDGRKSDRCERHVMDFSPTKQLHAEHGHIHERHN